MPPPPPPSGSSPEAIAAHRAHLVRVLGYDPAIEHRPLGSVAVVWVLALIFTIVVWALGLAYILSL